MGTGFTRVSGGGLTYKPCVTELRLVSVTKEFGTQSLSGRSNHCISKDPR